MCRWTLGTVERRCGVLLDPNSGVVGRIRGREFHLSSDPPEIETFFFFSNVSKHYFMRYAGSLDVRCVRTCVCNPAAVKVVEELHARSKGYLTSVVATERAPATPSMERPQMEVACSFSFVNIQPLFLI